MIFYDDLYFEELANQIAQWGYPAFRAKQLFHALHVQKSCILEECFVLPKAMLRDLSQRGAVSTLEEANMIESQYDGTKRYIHRLWDGEMVESVYLPYKGRATACISSQVGCNMGCVFCASTKGGKARDLKAAEMLQQIYHMERSVGRRIDNIVVMGQGEPLDNYPSLLRFLKLCSDPRGAHKSLRKITISTCGLVPQILLLAQEELPITLAVSLHRTDDVHRSALMPINRAYPIAELIEALVYYRRRTGRRISFEYMVISGENDRPEDVKKLRQYCRMTGAHVNVLSLNPIDEFCRFSPQKDAAAFVARLKEVGVNASLRKSMGADIEGACGQLRRKFQEESQKEG